MLLSLGSLNTSRREVKETQQMDVLLIYQLQKKVVSTLFFQSGGSYLYCCPGCTWQCLEMFLTGECATGISGWRSGMLLSIPQCAGQPRSTRQTMQCNLSAVLRQRKPALDHPILFPVHGGLRKRGNWKPHIHYILKDSGKPPKYTCLHRLVTGALKFTTQSIPWS